MTSRRLILLLLLLLVTVDCSAGSKSRKKQKPSAPQNPGTITLGQLFPEHLHPGFIACNKEQDHYQGVCILKAAFDNQIKLLNNASSSAPGRNTTCRYVYEGGASLHKYATEASEHLKDLIERYSIMHAQCISADHHSLENINEGTVKALQCRYIQWSCASGPADKSMSLVSTFLYAILSQRVLLIDDSSWGKLFCDALPTRSPKLALTPHYTSYGFGFSLETSGFPLLFESYLKCYQDSRNWRACSQSGIVQIVFSESSSDHHSFLYDPAATASVRNIPVLNFHNSNQYFAVGFFQNPILRPVLETIFPERRVFHNLARLLLKPSDQVWERIKQVQDRHFSPAVRTIGVESMAEYQDIYDVSIPRCIRHNAGLCPIDIEEFKKENNTTKNPNLEDEFISVYVSRPLDGHTKNLTTSLLLMEEETGQAFRIVVQEQTDDDILAEQHSLADIWLLSLSDVLLTSHISTSGYTAQGLAGITPLFLNPWPNDPCWWGISSDPCFHFAPTSISRPAYIKACPDLPGSGLQLLEA